MFVEEELLRHITFLVNISTERQKVADLVRTDDELGLDSETVCHDLKSSRCCRRGFVQI